MCVNLTNVKRNQSAAADWDEILAPWLVLEPVMEGGVMGVCVCEWGGGGDCRKVTPEFCGYQAF